MNKKKALLIIIPIIVIVISYFLFSPSGTTKEHVKIGKVLEFYGKVELKKGQENKVFNVFENMTFTQGDTVLTGQSSLIKLAFDVDKEVTVTSNTELVISQLVESVKAKSGKTNLDLQGGKVKVKIDKKLEGESEFKVRTPNAIMGVMGTEFYVYYNGQETWVGTVEGVVSVQVIGEDEAPILVEADQSVLIGEQGSSDVMEMDEEQLQLFEENLDEEGARGEENIGSQEDVASEMSDTDEGAEIPEETVVASLPEQRRTNATNRVPGEQGTIKRPVAEKPNEENQPIDEAPVVLPPIQEPEVEQPPVVEEEVPPVDGEDTPPVDEEELLPEDEEDIPPVDEEELPPEDEEEIPPVDEEESPPVDGGSYPPIDWGGGSGGNQGGDGNNPGEGDCVGISPGEECGDDISNNCEGISEGEECGVDIPDNCEGISEGEECGDDISNNCEGISEGEECGVDIPNNCEGISEGEECGVDIPNNCEGISEGEECGVDIPNNCEGISEGEECGDDIPNNCEGISEGEECVVDIPNNCEGISEGEECVDIPGENEDGNGSDEGIDGDSLDGNREDEEIPSP
ncbi:FecR family protein [Sporosarcina sp. CAU 1771]